MCEAFMNNVNELMSQLRIEGNANAVPTLESLNALFLSFNEDMRLISDEEREIQHKKQLEAQRLFFSAGLEIIDRITSNSNRPTVPTREEEIMQVEIVNNVPISTEHQAIQGAASLEAQMKQNSTVLEQSQLPVQQQLPDQKQLTTPVLEPDEQWGEMEEPTPPPTNLRLESSSNEQSNQVSDWTSLPYIDYEDLFRPLFVLQPMERVDEFALNMILVTITDIQERAKDLNYSLEKEIPMIIAFSQSRLDTTSRSLWMWQLDRAEPSINDFINFLVKRSKRVEPYEKSAVRSVQSSPRTLMPSELPSTSQQAKKSKIVCAYCHGGHYLHKCEYFKTLALKAKRTTLDQARLCHNCFSAAHLTGACKQGVCKRCNAKHNSILCPKGNNH